MLAHCRAPATPSSRGATHKAAREDGDVGRVVPRPVPAAPHVERTSPVAGPTVVLSRASCTACRSWNARCSTDGGGDPAAAPQVPTNADRRPTGDTTIGCGARIRRRRSASRRGTVRTQLSDGSVAWRGRQRRGAARELSPKRPGAPRDWTIRPRTRTTSAPDSHQSSVKNDLHYLRRNESSFAQGAYDSPPLAPRSLIPFPSPPLEPRMLEDRAIDA